MRLTSRGFTLTELMVALTLTGVSSSVILKTLSSSRQSMTTLGARIELQQNLRDGMTYTSMLVRELDATGGDILQMDSASITLRAMEWIGMLCAMPTRTGSNVLLPLRTSDLFGTRMPNSTSDSVLLYRDGDTGTQTDDRWLVGAVKTTTNGTCTDGSGAEVVTVDIAPASGGADSVMVGVTFGSPLRGFQVQRLSVVTNNSRWWLAETGANGAGGWLAPQRLLGPLTPNGIGFAYRDSTDAVTTNRGDVASIEITLRGESATRAKNGRGTIDYLTDSLSTRVALRNNAR